MPEFAYVPDRGEFLCSHGTGHYPVWAPTTVHGHGCNCCITERFPGREPKRGDLALCGRGSLGVILDRTKRKVMYGNGTESLAWMGFHLTNAINGVGSIWSSRNPCIIGNVNQFAFMKLTPEEWGEAIYTLAAENVIEHWPWKKPRTKMTTKTRHHLAEIVKFFVER
jgi:hypothetical protein